MTKLGKRLKYQSEDDKPVTISLRLPRELHARLEQYATQHRQSISELMRDGLEWRLSEGDPRGLGDASTRDDEEYYMSNTANALADMRQALARQEAQIQTIVQALERQTTPASNGLYEGVSYPVIHSNTAREPVESQRRGEPEPASAPMVKVDKEEVIGRIQQMRDKGLDSAQIAETLQAEGVPTLSAEAQLQVVVDMLEHSAGQDSSEGNTRSTSPASMDTIPAVQPTVLQGAQSPALARVERPMFDPTRHHLGTLCRNKHAWGSTGQSLRNADNQCLECRALAKREKDARKRAQREAATT